MPSRFIDELPPEHVDAVSETGYSGLPAAADAFTGTIEDLGERSDYQSPGWKRLKENAARPTGSPPREASGLAATASGTSGFITGARVFHDKFGLSSDFVLGISSDADREEVA